MGLYSVQFKFKTETDLYSLAKAKTTVSALEVGFFPFLSSYE